MKLVYAIVVVIALASCAKTEPVETLAPQKVFMRVEAVDPGIDTSYSQVIVVTLK